MDTTTELGRLSAHAASFLSLLQLVSPALPVGAYSYSEGLEALVEGRKIVNAVTLQEWVQQELRYGAIRLEAAVMQRGYRAIATGQVDDLLQWNYWLSAARDAEELRLQSWQMGRSLLRLLRELTPTGHSSLVWQRLQTEECNGECNFAIAFGVAAVDWQIDLTTATLGYLHSWAANLVGAGVRLIPLGQTAGQQVLLALQPTLIATVDALTTMGDEALDSWGWGLALASMAHEVQYSRLFRS